jgi:type II restriction enzyme
MNDITEKAIDSVVTGLVSFCRFITANDTGSTGGHQSGFYIPKTAYSIFFDKKAEKGSNKDKFIKIKWQNDFETENRAIYYGKGTRNEYRLTRFGKGFPFLEEQFAGGLLIITKCADDYYQAFVLNNDNDIDNFLEAFGMTPVDTGGLISKEKIPYTPNIEGLIKDFISSLPKSFPDTTTIANTTRKICLFTGRIDANLIIKKPDDSLLQLIRTEYELFKRIEIHYYSDLLSLVFNSVDEFIKKANMILNRRKSRAGKSLEHHLDAVFHSNNLRFSHPGQTEGNKKPDFIFPGNNEYFSSSFSRNKLVFLGAKTTCKDRWRQILNEADKIEIKHLFTLQQGISSNQLREMYESQVILVVPQSFISTYPKEYQERILNLESFIRYAKEKQAR